MTPARDNERERGAFEAWAEREMPWVLDEAETDSERLCKTVATIAFQRGWQARAAASPAASEVVEEAMRLAHNVRQAPVGGPHIEALRAFLTANLAPAPEPLAERVGWTPVADQMPPPGRAVLAVFTYDHHNHGRQSICRAAWIPEKFEEANQDSDNGVYDEETDTYWTPAGWYEQISHWDEFSGVAIAGATVSHWQPLPAAPSGIRPNDGHATTPNTKD